MVKRDMVILPMNNTARTAMPLKPVEHLQCRRPGNNTGYECSETATRPVLGKDSGLFSFFKA